MGGDPGAGERDKIFVSRRPNFDGESRIVYPRALNPIRRLPVFPKCDRAATLERNVYCKILLPLPPPRAGATAHPAAAPPRRDAGSDASRYGTLLNVIATRDGNNVHRDCAASRRTALFSATISRTLFPSYSLVSMERAPPIFAVVNWSLSPRRVKIPSDASRKFRNI